MSFVKLNKSNFATTSVDLHTPRTFVSSSQGVTGALKVIVDRSPTQKDNIDDRVGLTGQNAPQTFGEGTFEGRRIIIMDALASSDIAAALGGYSFSGAYNIGELELGQLLDGVGVGAGAEPPEYEKYGLDAGGEGITETGYSDISMHPRNSTELLIRALKPTASVLSSGSMALTLAEKTLEPYYRPANSAYGSKFTNFSCMNFFKPAGNEAVIVYPGFSGPTSTGTRLYSFDGDFTVEFWIKPRPETDVGTVIHLPGFFSVSVLTGSETNELGAPVNYHLGLAAGKNVTRQSDGVPFHLDYLSTATPGNVLAKSLPFLKNDVWTHCAITYETTSGNVSFYVDGELSSSEIKRTNASYDELYEILCLGGYMKAASSTRGKFQGQLAQGLGARGKDSVSAHWSVSHSDTFNSFLNADLHEIRFFNKALNQKQITENIYTTYTGSKDDLNAQNLKFYVPCLYDVDYRSTATHVVAPEFTDSKEEYIDSRPNGFKVPYAQQHITSATAVDSLRQGVQNLTASIEPDDLAPMFNVRPSVHRRVQAAPYNTNHANIGSFANVNVQSFLKDYANLSFPFLHHVSESIGDIDPGTSPVALYNIESFSSNGTFATTVHQLTSSFANVLGHQHRNCFILPCDNGDFKPNYKTLNHPTGSKFLQRDGFFINTKNIGDLNDMSDSRLFFMDDAFVVRDAFESPAFGSETTMGGDTRYNSGVELFAVTDESRPDIDLPRIEIPELNNGEFTRTAFEASDFPGPLTTIITVPQLYYGNRIQPGSIKLSSYLYSGSASHVELRDNGHGMLYRHQASGSNADWNKVGDVYYAEGLIYIRHPSLYAFGDNNMTVEFKSDNRINVLETNVFCNAAMINSSSNPNYNKLRPSSNENEQAEDFVYISTVYLHDNNLNVVGKAKLSQPIVKRSENKFLFRLKMDF